MSAASQESDQNALFCSSTSTFNFNSSLRDALMTWFQEAGRHDLPWRETFSPYDVLVSEFMLQQTTVATIIPRFQKWKKLFPTMESLAAASEDHVLAAWQGLGYYARARRLHAVAKRVVSECAGKIPNDLEKLLALPGIGPYTAKAILAFAFDEPIEVLDTNIIRVIARLNNITEPIDTKAGALLLQHSAQQLLPKKRGRAFASALMDLGATICVATEPQCTSCPLSDLCAAEEPGTLPRKQPRVATTHKKERRVFHYDDGKIYLEKSSGPLWKGLWILPLDTAPPRLQKKITSIVYPITRYRVTMELYRPSEAIPKGLHPFSIDALKKIAIPSPHRKAIEACLLAANRV